MNKQIEQLKVLYKVKSLRVMYKSLKQKVSEFYAFFVRVNFWFKCPYINIVSFQQPHVNRIIVSGNNIYIYISAVCLTLKKVFIVGMMNGTTNVALMAFLASDFIYHPSGEAMTCMGHVGQFILSQVLLVLRGVRIWRNVDDLWAMRMVVFTMFLHFICKEKIYHVNLTVPIRNAC